MLVPLPHPGPAIPFPASLGSPCPSTGSSDQLATLQPNRDYGIERKPIRRPEASSESFPPPAQRRALLTRFGVAYATSNRYCRMEATTGEALRFSGELRVDPRELVSLRCAIRAGQALEAVRLEAPANAGRDGQDFVEIT